ncbi:MAG TPA: hypothetical protein QGG35_07875 [Candidatus Marinimicrobia bacterium]|jgi:hypothetical protein|nr:hypothetical protein [Candidatus Neomarinimicrobiota bacterium]HJL85307.1 hypothetical protein [Candidatus Neomarinimicrobiota bacterium]
MYQFLKTVLAITLIPFALWAQDDFYPSEPYYGGGVGFSEMFLFIDVGKLDGFELLGTVTDTAGNSTGLGFNTADFSSPFVVYGGEGFSQVTGRWRIGGYAGLGNSSIGDRNEITLFLDENTDGVFDVDEATQTYDGDVPDKQVSFTLLISGAIVEYTIPILRGLELNAGALMGLGSVTAKITQSSGGGGWSDQFTDMYSLSPDGYYAVGDLDTSGTIDTDDFALVEFETSATGSSMRSLKGSFFNMQPYAGVKLQFLDRMGLKMTVGYNLGSVQQGKWILNDLEKISDSQATPFNGLAVRAMIYFGL